MEIWVDTSDANLVTEAASLGVLDGVTTNPTILASSTFCLEEIVEKLLEVQNGLVAVQVLADDVQGMCAEAKLLAAFSDRILVKIPATQNGFRAIYALGQEGISTLATAIFTPQQALLAFKTGASYLAPYLGRIADTGKNPIAVLSQMHAMKKHYDFPGKIMAAGIRELTISMACMEMGICAMTLPEKVFREFAQDYEPTLVALKKFSENSMKNGAASLLKLVKPVR